jgi:hypothetical protein
MTHFRHSIKVKELLKHLEKADPNALVVMFSDSEGNSIGVLNDVDFGVYNKKDEEFGYSELTKDMINRGYSEDDLIIGVPAVLLMPQ